MLIKSYSNKKFCYLKDFYYCNKNYINYSLKIITAFCLLFYLIENVDYNEIISSLNNINFLMLFPVIFFAFFNIFFQYKKWELTVNALLKEYDNKKIIRSLFYGFSGGIITPARIGEFFGRGIPFAGKPVTRIISSVLIDKYFTLFHIILFGTISGIIFIYTFLHGFFAVSISLLLFSVFILLFLIKSDFIKKFIFKRKIFSQLNELKKEMNRKFITKSIIFSFLFYLCFIFQFAFLAAAFSGNYNFISFLWISSIIIFVKSVIPSVSFGELGIREGVSVFFFSKIGETISAGFNSAFFIFIINLLIPSIIGLFLLIKKNNGR